MTTENWLSNEAVETQFRNVQSPAVRFGQWYPVDTEIRRVPPSIALPMGFCRGHTGLKSFANHQRIGRSCANALARTRRDDARR